VWELIELHPPTVFLLKRATCVEEIISGDLKRGWP
jgi:hypothetical protein